VAAPLPLPQPEAAQPLPSPPVLLLQQPLHPEHPLQPPQLLLHLLLAQRLHLLLPRLAAQELLPPLPLARLLLLQLAVLLLLLPLEMAPQQRQLLARLLPLLLQVRSDRN
jgi:hypothetical protein